MSLCVLGWGGEFKGKIAANAIWPRTAIATAAIANVLAAFKGDALLEEYMDGISLEFAEWRFNLRSSNTEPVVRLNVEGRGNQALVDTKTAEILAILRA